MYPDLAHATKKMYLEAAERDDIYPVTMLKDKYNGVYSDGTWLAFNLEAHEVPKFFSEDEHISRAFWLTHKQVDFAIGKGDTPDRAYANLRKNLILYWQHQ